MKRIFEAGNNKNHRVNEGIVNSPEDSLFEKSERG